MKSASILTVLLMSSLFVLLILTSSCSSDQGLFTSSDLSENTRLDYRSDYSGLEVLVKIKISARDNIPTTSILTCTYLGLSTDGYGKYTFTTATTTGNYFVTGIIGDEIEGF